MFLIFRSATGKKAEPTTTGKKSAPTSIGEKADSAKANGQTEGPPKPPTAQQKRRGKNMKPKGVSMASTDDDKEMERYIRENQNRRSTQQIVCDKARSTVRAVLNLFSEGPAVEDSKIA